MSGRGPIGELYRESPRNTLTQAACLWGGLAGRYAGSGLVWSALRLLWARFRGTAESRESAARGVRDDWKMWAGSLAADSAVSLAFMPHQWLAASHCGRLIVGFANFRVAEMMSVVDRFDGRAFLTFSSQAFTHASAETDYSFLLWCAPSSLLTIAKLCYRRFVLKKNTKLKRCVAMLVLQYASRVVPSPFCVTLATNEIQVIIALGGILLDKWTSAWLVRNTWPWP